MEQPEWLPDWFDLKNYDSAANMNLSAWAHALHIRSDIASTDFKNYENERDDMIKMLVIISKKPNGDWAEPHIHNKADKSPDWRTVSPLRISRIVQFGTI